MSDTTEAFTRKLGPLPAWAWGLGLGLGIVGFRAYKDRKAAAAAVITAEGQAAAEQQQPGTSVQDQGYTPGTIGSYSLPAAASNPGGSYGYSSSGPDASTGSTGPVDNTAWRQQAAAKLIELHYAPTAASEAIETYLRGDPITEQQEAMIDTAIRSIGSPPDGAPPILRKPNSSPTPQPPAAPAAATSSAPPPPLQQAPAPFQLPSYLQGVRFVKGSGPAVYQVTPAGIEWVPSEAALTAAGGSLLDAAPLSARVVNIGDTALGPLKRIGTLPPPGTDASL